MSKYPEAFKLEVINYHLSGQGGTIRTAQQFGIPRINVRTWICAYERNGVEGLSHRGRRYDGQFRRQVVEHMHEHDLSLNATAKHFNVLFSTVALWDKIYRERGTDALLNTKRGRPSPMSQPHKKPSALKPDKEKTQEELLAEVRYLRAEVDYLKKLKALNQARETVCAKTRAQIVNELRQKHALYDLLRIAALSRSTFYYHCQKQKLPDRYALEKQAIQSTFHQHKGRYGYRRITCVMRQQGYMINHKTVQKLMKQLNLASFIRIKKYRSYKGHVGQVVPNLLQRQFAAGQPNRKWVTDVTEFNVSGEKLYLSPVMDLYNNEIISCELARRPHFDMVQKMLSEAISRLKPGDMPLLHSDQGWQYQMKPYQKTLRQHKLTQSMSRKGNCLDNAAMESFFGTLKSECFYIKKFDSVEQLESEIREYIHYYNHDRIRLKLNGLSPVQFRTQSNLSP
ncbi:IS3 family transposase [Oxalobacter vibrioformis]|uniref:IS3 family transposase n=1 Tax=Oxalobacter vibrioformis TaxID=933080 RepID=UPI0038CD691A